VEQLGHQNNCPLHERHIYTEVFITNVASQAPRVLFALTSFPNRDFVGLVEVAHAWYHLVYIYPTN
jgi:hypothetical protein